MTTIVLCGSTRFRNQFKEANYELSRLGYTVLTLADPKADGEPLDAVDKIMFDLVYFEKIRMADAVLLIDGVPSFDHDSSQDPYVGFSTAREILWATMQDKPIFSLLSATGWGNIVESFDNRYDVNYMGAHLWIADHAKQVLRTDVGVDVVKEQVEKGQHDIMLAGLSVIAAQGRDMVSSYATSILELAGLDPIEMLPPTVPKWIYNSKPRDIGDHSGYVDTMDGPVGARGETVNGRMEQKVAETELMVSIERRKLVGTIIMVQAMIEMAQEKGSRKDVLDKLIMTNETIMRSFGVEQSTVQLELIGNGGMDFPIAE